MKIIHTSDWHLGAKLKDEDRAEEHRAFLDWLFEQMKEEKPDALLIAGDVFDTAAPSASAMKMYHEFIAHAILEAGCRNIVITGGNHDSPSWLGMSRTPLECMGAMVIPAAEDDIGRECVFIERDGRVALAVAAIPYLRENELANLVRRENDERSHDELVRAGYAEHCRRAVAEARAKAGTAPVVMMGHCVLSGSRLSDEVSERQRGIFRESEVGGVKSVDFDTLPEVDYLALGHLHIPQKVAGRDAARYSGSPIPMSFSETDAPKQILVVTLGEKSGDAVSVVEKPVPCFHALERLEGSPEEIEKRLLELAIGDAAVFVEIGVTSGEGDLSPWWAKYAAIQAEHTNIEILTERDRRKLVAIGTGLEALAAAGGDLAALDEMSVARARLDEEKPTDEDRATFERLLEEVIAEVKSGVLDADGNEND
jgi:exonuclease SbcD